MTALDQIRAKVEEVRKEHAAPNESGAKYADLCISCDTLWPCDALRWAETALKLAAMVASFEAECRNQIIRGDIEGLSPDGPYAALWNRLQAEAERLLSEIAGMERDSQRPKE